MMKWSIFRSGIGIFGVVSGRSVLGGPREGKKDSKCSYKSCAHPGRIIRGPGLRHLLSAAQLRCYTRSSFVGLYLGCSHRFGGPFFRASNLGLFRRFSSSEYARKKGRGKKSKKKEIRKFLKIEFVWFSWDRFFFASKKRRIRQYLITALSTLPKSRIRDYFKAITTL